MKVKKQSYKELARNAITVCILNRIRENTRLHNVQTIYMDSIDTLVNDFLESRTMLNRKILVKSIMQDSCGYERIADIVLTEYGDVFVSMDTNNRIDK